jgi:CHASE2 domain-containing sensor protein
MTDTPTVRRFLVALALIATLAGVASSLARPAYARLEGSMLALAQWLRPADAANVAWYDTAAPGGTSVDRGTLADAILRLSAIGPRAIVVMQPLEGAGGSADLARVRGFLESPEAAADGALRTRLQAWVAELDYDARLEQALQKSGVVVLHARSADDGSAPAETEQTSLASKSLAGDALPAPVSALAPLPRFQAAARAVGTEAADAGDADGIQRVQFLLAGDAEGGVPSLAAAAWLAAHGASPAEATWRDGRLATSKAALAAGDDSGWVPWYARDPGKPRRARGNVSNLVARASAPADLAGRIVVLGSASARVATPAGTLAAPDALAQQIASLQATDYARRPAWSWLFGALLILAAPAALTFAGGRLSPTTRLLASLGAVAAVALLELVVLVGAKIWLPLLGPALAFPVAALATLIPRRERSSVSVDTQRAGLTPRSPPSRRDVRPAPTETPTSAQAGTRGADAPARRLPPRPQPASDATVPVAPQSTRRIAEAAVTHPVSLRDINERLRARQEDQSRVDVADLLLGRSKRPPKPRLGRYELERELGHGAMGTVYLGRDPNINRVVAVKAIPLAQEFEGDALAEARSRFFREAEMAGRLNHPSIVTVYDAGEDGGIAFIAMEYVKGRLLSDHATSDVLLPAPQVLEICARIADALDYAHAQDIVHRDIKPANVIFDPQSSETKITDFGIARLTNSSSTRTGIVLGTPSFMAPEQLEGRFVTGRSDLFSLGVTLFQLLAGQLPFRADSMTALMDKIANAPHPPLRTIRPDLPPCVGLIVDRALQKDPTRRFANGGEMARALRACARSVAA